MKAKDNSLRIYCVSVLKHKHNFFVLFSLEFWHNTLHKIYLSRLTIGDKMPKPAMINSVPDCNYNYSLDLNLSYKRNKDTKKEITIEIPEKFEYFMLDSSAEGKYWERNLKFTLFPLLLCGIPVHLLFLPKSLSRK